MLCGGCKENYELGTSCKLAPAEIINIPPSPLQKGGDGAVVLCGGCKENYELGTSCKLAPVGDNQMINLNFDAFDLIKNSKEGLLSK